MPMKKCRECGADISSLAKSCPKCGAPSPAEAMQSVGAFLFVVGILILLVIWFLTKFVK